MWRRRLATGVLVAWLVVCVARLSRLVEPPEVAPGAAAVPFIHFLRDRIATDDGYLLVLPTEFGSDTGIGPRMRYDLYPRRYEDARAALDVGDARLLLTNGDLQYVVIVDASALPADHWARTPPPWLEQVDFDAHQYLLRVRR